MLRGGSSVVPGGVAIEPVKMSETVTQADFLMHPQERNLHGMVSLHLFPLSVICLAGPLTQSHLRRCSEATSCVWPTSFPTRTSSSLLGRPCASCVSTPALPRPDAAADPVLPALSTRSPSSSLSQLAPSCTLRLPLHTAHKRTRSTRRSRPTSSMSARVCARRRTTSTLREFAYSRF